MSAALQVFLVETMGRESEDERGCEKSDRSIRIAEVEFRSESALLSYKTVARSKSQALHSQYSKVWHCRRLGSRLSASGSKPHLRFTFYSSPNLKTKPERILLCKETPTQSTASKLKRPSPYHAILHQPYHPSPSRAQNPPVHLISPTTREINVYFCSTFTIVSNVILFVCT